MNGHHTSGQRTLHAVPEASTRIVSGSVDWRQRIRNLDKRRLPTRVEQTGRGGVAGERRAVASAVGLQVPGGPRVQPCDAAHARSCQRECQHAQSRNGGEMAPWPPQSKTATITGRATSGGRHRPATHQTAHCPSHCTLNPIVLMPVPCGNAGGTGARAERARRIAETARTRTPSRGFVCHLPRHHHDAP